MKLAVSQADLVMAVAAARTAWILTDIDRKRGYGVLSQDDSWSSVAGIVNNVLSGSSPGAVLQPILQPVSQQVARTNTPECEG
jgi:hypothetical protein